jgi:hypothetical protein
MLNLEVVRGPLPSDQDYRTIFAEYQRLTQSYDSERFMHRWCKDSPVGPALHTLLRTDEGRIVGHACIIPFPIEFAGRRMIGGKGHYLFVHEDFRREPVRGMEASRSRAGTLLVQQLFRHAVEELAWDPLLMSPVPRAERVLEAAGCRTLTFKPFECLLIRRPWNACRFTPNLSRGKRLALFLLGLPQTCIWGALSRLLLPFGRNMESIPMDARVPSSGNREKAARIEDRGFMIEGNQSVCNPANSILHSQCAKFSSDPDYLSWRYPEEGFGRFGFANRLNDYVITEKGSPHTYVRICQSHLDSKDFPVLSLIVGLMGQARSCDALGVRWPIYGNGQPSPAVVNKLKHLGFVCGRRQRRFLIYTRHDELADPSYWSFDDSLITYK